METCSVKVPASAGSGVIATRRDVMGQGVLSVAALTLPWADLGFATPPAFAGIP